MKTQKMIYAALLFAGLFFLASCQPVDFDGPQLAADSATAVQTYSVSIPAVFDDGAQTKALAFDGESGISHTFTDDGTEVVHVAIAANNGEILAFAGTIEDDVLVPTALTPTNISQDGKHCTLTGENLTFYSRDDEGDFHGYAVKNNDKFNLYYQMPQDDTYRFGGNYLMGYAEATGVSMDIDQEQHTMTLNESVNFTNVGSVFRQQLSFKNEQGEIITPTPAIRKLTIKSTSGKTISAYNPLGVNEILHGYHFNNRYTYAPIVLTDPDNVLDAEGNVKFSMFFTEDNQGNAITMEAVDAEGTHYIYTQNAPQGGFQNGKYYYSQNAKAFTFYVSPGSVTLSHSGEQGTPVEPTSQEEYTYYEIDGLNDGDVLTISGYFEDSRFETGINGGEIVFDNLKATLEGTNIDTFLYAFVDFNPFEQDDDEDDVILNLLLKGNNSISCNYVSLRSEAGLKLSCDGSSATLAVTVNYKDYKGLYSENYDARFYDPSCLAAPGHVVTLDSNHSGSNGDGTFTYTYVVTKITNNNIDLSEFDSPLIGAFTALDGMTLTGTLHGPFNLSIADGATVTLNGVTIDRNCLDKFNMSYSGFAGITCEGDATLLLPDGTTNTINGCGYYYPGIFVPEDKTLKIDKKDGDEGTGSLIVSSAPYTENGVIWLDGETGEPEYHSAGIGGGSYPDVYNCGNILIQGGHITATGNPGIGSHTVCGDITISGGTVIANGKQASGIGWMNYCSCGDITISGGNVTAYGDNYYPGIGAGLNYGGDYYGDITISGGTVVAVGGESAAGIGSGSDDACGAITITLEYGGSVTATKGQKGEDTDDEYLADVIGRGEYGTCGIIAFGNQQVFDGSAWISPFEAGDHGGLTLGILNDGRTWTLTKPQE